LFLLTLSMDVACGRQPTFPVPNCAKSKKPWKHHLYLGCGKSKCS
jgi:hypothetical protein